MLHTRIEPRKDDERTLQLLRMQLYYVSISQFVA